jgi:hypothetical protein
MSASENPDIYQVRANVVKEEQNLGPAWHDVDALAFSQCPPVNRRIVVGKEHFIAATTGFQANAGALEYQTNKNVNLHKQIDRLNENIENIFIDLDLILDTYTKMARLNPSAAEAILADVREGLRKYQEDVSFVEDLKLNVIKQRFSTALKDERAESFSISASDLRVLVERAK